MKKRNSKGVLSTYLNWPIIVAIYLFLVLVIVYIIDANAGAILLPFFSFHHFLLQKQFLGIKLCNEDTKEHTLKLLILDII